MLPHAIQSLSLLYYLCFVVPYTINHFVCLFYILHLYVFNISLGKGAYITLHSAPLFLLAVEKWNMLAVEFKAGSVNEI